MNELTNHRNKSTLSSIHPSSPTGEYYSRVCPSSLWSAAAWSILFSSDHYGNSTALAVCAAFSSCKQWKPSSMTKLPLCKRPEEKHQQAHKLKTLNSNQGPGNHFQEKEGEKPQTYCHWNSLPTQPEWTRFIQYNFGIMVSLLFLLLIRLLRD